MLMRLSLYCLLCGSCLLASASQISTAATPIKKSDTVTSQKETTPEQKIAQEIFNLWESCTWDKDFNSTFKQSINLIPPKPSKVRQFLQNMIEKNMTGIFTEAYYKTPTKPEYTLDQLIYILGINHLHKLYEPEYSDWKAQQKGTMINAETYYKQLINSPILQTFAPARFNLIFVGFYTQNFANAIKPKANK